MHMFTDVIDNLPLIGKYESAEASMANVKTVLPTALKIDDAQSILIASAHSCLVKANLDLR